MTSYTAQAFAVNLAYMIVAMLAIYGASRFLNWHNGVKFGEHVLAEIKKQPMAVAMYYGLRWIGICYLAAALLR